VVAAHQSRTVKVNFRGLQKASGDVVVPRPNSKNNKKRLKNFQVTAHSFGLTTQVPGQ
jgi:hypothetical protein